MNSFKKNLTFSRVVCLTALLSALAGAGQEALAGDHIGVAASARNRVSGRIQANTVQISDGESVYDRELVRTEADSSAKLVMKDDSNINVGPNSSVTLDSFVYAGEQDFKKHSLNVAKGSLRFTSGSSDRRAYKVNTPTCTIGVRG